MNNSGNYRYRLGCEGYRPRQPPTIKAEKSRDRDKVREWHGHIYTTKRKIDSQWEATA